MTKLHVLAGVSLLAASQAYAAVPYSFTAGQPARASEVNANFKNLDDRVKSLESSSGSGGGSGSGSSTVYAHSLTYTATAATVGQEISIGGNTYRIIKVPIKTQGGTKYALTYPVQVRTYSSASSDAGRYYINSSLQVYHVKYPFTQTTTISGFPAQISVTDYLNFSHAGVFANSASGFGYWNQKAEATFDANAAVTVDLDGYRLSLNFGVSILQQSVPAIPNSTSDFTALDLSQVQDSATAISYLDQLVDYIKVELLP